MKTLKPIDSVYVVLDQSGSMGWIERVVVDQFNQYLSSLRAAGPATRLTLIEFDSVDPHEVVFADVPVGEVGPLSSESYSPQGGTPLLDAIGHAIDLATAHGSQRTRFRPLIAVITDGEENDSQIYDRSTLYAKVGRRRAAGWGFLFFGVGEESLDAARSIGLKPEEYVPWVADEGGTRTLFANLTEHSAPRRRRGC